MTIDKTKLEELIEKMKKEAQELGLDIEESSMRPRISGPKLPSRIRIRHVVSSALSGASSARPRVCLSALASAI